jgi:aminoglycoside phosphotransferase (APT) family kinase protein
VTGLAPIEDLSGRLAEWLGERTGIDGVTVDEVSRPAAGQSNDTVLITASFPDADRRRSEGLVIRRQSTGTTIFRDPDVIREYRVLEGLSGTRVPAPAVRWAETDPTVLGSPFFVMEQVHGRVPVGKPSIHAVGWLPTLTPAELEGLWASALDALVAIHEIDWRARHGFLVGDEGDDDGVESAAASGFPAYVDRLVDWYRWSAAGREYPITDAAADLLQRGAASVTSPSVLVWGDARVGNMIFGDDLAVAAAIDWETASVGPPEVDLAHWLFFDEFGTSAVGIDRLAGWPDRDTTIARYEAASGRRLGDLALFDVLDGLFMAGTLIRQADARVARGVAPPDTRMGHDNTVTQMLARQLGLPVPDLSPDYLAHRGMPTP